MNPFVFRNISYGLYILSSIEKDSQRKVGCIVNSLMQVTSSPATIAVSVNHDNYTNTCIGESGVFAISILPESCDPKTISTFGFNSSKDKNKFENADYSAIGGLPVMNIANGYILCKVQSKAETSTHTVFIGSVVDADVMSDEPSMTYAYYHQVIKGRSPKNAPTYIAQEDKKESSRKTGYRCTVCGYVYDGDIPFEDLPGDYKCPICSASKDKFEAIEV
ncbi:MAG TPA: flavin reductase [Clostridia bacterium]|nr:flavin reductase [Clostridia bacterium]